MGLSIKNPATERRARLLAEMTGETLTTAIDRALEERLDRVRQSRADRQAPLLAVLEELRSLPVIDDRDRSAHDDELYDSDGLPR